MILDFYIPGEPERTTAQEGHRWTRGHYYTDPKIKAVRQSLIEELKVQASAEEERIPDPQKVAEQLAAITKKIRSGRK